MKTFDYRDIPKGEKAILEKCKSNQWVVNVHPWENNFNEDGTQNHHIEILRRDKRMFTADGKLDDALVEAYRLAEG